MTRRAFLVLSLGAIGPCSPGGGSGIRSRLREYEIRPAYGPPFPLRQRYRENRNRGGTPFHAADTLAQLLAWSFKVEPLRVFGPQWIYDVRYEVYFRTNELTSQLTGILRELLVEEFLLRYRQGTQMVEALVLATGEGEPECAPSKSSECRVGRPASEPTMPDVEIRSAGPYTTPFPRMDLPVAETRVVFYRGCQVRDSIRDLQERFRRVVVDETTSQGRYDFEIHFPGGPRSVDHALGPIARQLTQKLGAELKLAPRQLEGTLVIDSAEHIMAPVVFQAEAPK